MRPQLDDGDYAEALAMVKGTFGALDADETAPSAAGIALDDLPATASTGAPRLTTFGRLRGVGAVSPEHELRFSDGLTVIYGQNAVGKTTYVRALKRVCRAVDCEGQLHGNVFAPGAESGPPTAKVELAVKGHQRAQQLDLANPDDLGLEAISVFDSECAELYVDHENAVAYVPAALRVLARLAATQDRMRRDLDAEAGALGRQRPTFPELTTDTAVKRFVDSLSEATKPDAIRAMASLSEAQRARLAELRAVVASAEARSAHSDAQAARQDSHQAAALAERLTQLGARLEGEPRASLRERAERAAAADAAVALASREFDGLEVDGVGGGPWRQLWQAARTFAEGSGGAFPPASGQACPLCLQHVSEEAAARLKHFEAHVRSSVQEDARRAQTELQSALEPLDAQHIAACRGAFLTGLRDREPELHGAVERYLDAVSSRMESLRADPATAQVLPLLNEPADRLTEWGAQRGAHADTLLAADDPVREREVRAELAELDSREKFGGRVADAEKWVKTLGRIAALQRAHSALAFNRITTKQRQLSEEVVTGALDAKLKQELGNLDCDHLPVSLHPETRVGETHVALRLAGAHGTPRVSDILSEGEQRALALAFFLSEVAASGGDGGIVVDDPVSSLDDERRDYIARRLVDEATRRQVVVFTHDLHFMYSLMERSQETGITPLVQGVWRMGDQVGRVDPNPPFKAMKLSERIGVLDQVVGQWDKQDPARDFDEAWRRVCDFYARLRTTWERAVEERLLQGVVTRFQREVKTRSLDDIKFTPEAVALVKDGMTRCSNFVHDEAPGTSTRLPGRREMNDDLEKLRELVKLTK